MVFKRFISRKGKRFGPYYYKNVRDGDGKVKSIYLGRAGIIRVDSRVLIVGIRSAEEGIAAAPQDPSPEMESVNGVNLADMEISDSQDAESPGIFGAAQCALDDGLEKVGLEKGEGIAEAKEAEMPEPEPGSAAGDSGIKLRRSPQ